VVDDAPDGAVLRIRVVPRAGNTAVAGTRDNALLIRLAAPPVDGAANAALIEFLARALDIPKRNLALISGEKSRTKRVKVTGVTATVIRQRLGLEQ
jgi:uncharacterized protein (TIGR00251 family)